MKFNVFTVATIMLFTNIFGYPTVNNNRNINETRSIFNKQIAKSLGFFSGTYTTDKNVLDTGKISGGYYAKQGQFPFMVVVHRLVGNGIISQCGGTIISKRWVLTAGHCVVNQPRRFLLVFGVISKSGIGYDFYQGNGVSMMTTTGAVHPNYKLTENDIALLYTPQDIPFSNTIQPISLAGHTNKLEKLDGKIANVIGWGRDSDSSTGTQELKYTVLPVISNAQCGFYWAVNDKNICTAPDLGTDACQGDSGGPLIITNNGKPFQIGIVSYGDKYCPSSLPGVFTRVSKFIKWIDDVMNNINE